jgi:hypothetical protein
MGQRLDGRRVLIGREVVSAEGPDNTGIGPVRSALHHRVETVLRQKGLLHGPAVQPHPGHSPTRVSGTGKGVEVAALVPTVEAADTDMDDRPGQCRTIVGRHLDSSGMQLQGCAAERYSGAFAKSDDIGHGATPAQSGEPSRLKEDQPGCWGRSLAEPEIPPLRPAKP